MIKFDRELNDRLHAVRNTANLTDKVIVGRLQTGDATRAERRCHVETLNGNVSCTFSDDLTTTILAATGSLVRVCGSAESTADQSVNTFEIHSFEIFCHAPYQTLDEIAAEQGFTPIASLAELRLSEPLSDEEYEEFLAAVMSARGDW
jgi:hypothetical protein